jgi:O-antigen/teichoic acid export membrane protein
MTLRSSLTSQSLRNAASSGFAALVTPALYFFAIPFLLSRLGAEDLGVWALLSVLFAIAGLADFGIGPATTLYVARYRGKQASEELLQVIQTAWGLYLVLVLLVMVVFFFLGQTLLGWLGVPSRVLSEISSFLPIFVFGVGMQFLFSALDGVIRGFERYDWSSLLRVISGSSNVITYCSIVALGGSLGGMIIGQTIIFTVLFLVGAWTVCQLLHRSAWLLPCIHVCSLKEFLNLNLYGWLQGLAGTLSSQADRLLVSILLGPAVLAYYAACLQLAQLTHSILAQTLAFTFPKFASLDANEPARLAIFNRGMLIATILGTGASLLLFIWAPRLLELWLGPGVPAEIITALRVLAVSNALTSTSILPSYLMLGMGHFRLAALAALASGLSIALGGYLLIAWVGVVGAALSRLAGLPITVVSRVLVYQRAFGSRRWLLGIRQLLPVLLAFLPVWLFLCGQTSVGDSLSVLNGLLALAIGSVTVIFLSRQLYGPLRAVVVTPETNE